MFVDRYIIYGAMAILLWSATVALVRSITRKIDAIQTGAYMFGGAGFACMLIIFFSEDIFSFFDHSCCIGADYFGRDRSLDHVCYLDDLFFLIICSFFEHQ